MVFLAAAMVGCDKESNFYGAQDTTTNADGTEITYSLDSLYILPTSEITVDATTTVYAKVKNSNGVLASGQTVYFSIDNGLVDGVASTTASTNSNGIAQVTLTAPALVGSGTVTAYLAGGTPQTASVTYKAGSPYSITLKASPTSVGAGGGSTISAEVFDQHLNVITSGYLEFGSSGADNVSGNSLNGFPTGETALAQISNGKASITYTAGTTTPATDTITVVPSGATTPTKSIDIVVTSAATNVGSISLNPAKSSITANGASATAIEVTVLDRDGAPMESQDVEISTTAGDFNTSSSGTSSDTITTDGDGIATVLLYSSSSLEKAYITASVGGFTEIATVDFVAGPPVAANSSITISPSTLPADGSTTATVTVVLADADSHPVTDGTSVTLLGMTNDAVVTPISATTVAGRATFTLQAASESATDTLYLAEDSGITGSVTYGQTGTGDPSNIQVTSAEQHIYVAGVGQTENTKVTVTLKDDAGSLVANPGYDNLRVSLLTKPNGGEFLSGVNNAGTTVTSTSSIDIVTASGQAVFNIQAGTLPGIVEVRIDVLDSGGSTTTVSAIVPQIVIASGPAHAITFTYPITDAVINDGNGVYSRKGSVIVADRYGNPVVDGTVVNLGMIDTVIASGSDGDTATNSGALTSVATDLSTASVTRNGIARFIEANDRVLLLDSVAGDKSRFASAAATDANTLPVQTAYTGGETNLNFIVGSTESDLGSTISGVDGSNLTAGRVTTENGVGEIRITYPANVSTILTGCSLAAPDTRTTPADSGDVFVVGTVSDTDATTVTSKFCYSAIAGYTLTVTPAEIDKDSNIGLELRDGGDTIPLPFVGVTSNVLYTKNAGGLTVTHSAGCANTDINGGCTATITVVGGASGDSAEVTFYAGDASATVTVSKP